ncbi:bis(5'-nucleosyl)-tetraphosphatase (symmetrical) YqeK [Paenibacillus guangzhouensis]|uniref:bis(5'-nucleosyl)-tetraphosphatase (symmetrical) YqeK n=1 Tax=Paenibacillus guangzhouensis TaxID=1473112 RepID=UPI001266EC03|nr:bis(5'-nucleosyl)-tetraphosphatase (symmetrical) YqeK [Paenibacillus guangzhouensis]
MHAAYHPLKLEPLTGDLRKDIVQFLRLNGCPKTAEHSIRVGREAKRVAELYQVNAMSAEIAGYLHDISAVYANDVRIEVARSLGIDILPEEESFPLIIHQKISREMASDLFHIHDQDILDAVGCHTTLRQDATLLDKVLFVADKIEWDQAGSPPYLNQIMQQLDKSLDHATYEYINYLWRQKEKLRVVHPWLRDAYYELRAQME